MEELGVVNDSTVIEGATPGDIWQQVSKHLKDNHKIKLPDLEDIGDGGLLPVVPRFDNASVAGQQGPVIATAGRIENDDNQAARVIATRLIEKLHVGQQGSGSSDIVPPGGTQSPMP
jgi:hypothetical protein